MMEGQSGDPGVALVFTRRVKAGHETAYEEWIGRIQVSTRGFPGYRGVEVIRPAAPGGEYTSIVRFDNAPDLRRWEQSQARKEWLLAIPHAAVDGDARVRRVDGVEFWFTAEGAPAASVPARNRMAAVLIVIVFVLVMALGTVLRALLPDAPAPIAVLIAVTLQVLLMTYVIMPRVTKILGSWLFPGTS